MQNKLIISVLISLTGTALVLFSIGGIFSLSIGAALGPVESAWYIAPLVSCFVGAALVLYAYFKAAFARRWVKVTVLIIYVLPVSGLGLLAGLQTVYIAAMPFFEETKIIKRDVLFEHGWHFVNSNSYFGIRGKKLHQCITRLGTKRLVATLEVTLNYGKVSYFRVLKFEECKVESPGRNPNYIVPPYTRGEEINDYT